jgi:hypothetical protein
MTFILYAFNMTQHRSLYGAKVKTPEQLCQRLLTAINKGAEVISIRIYKEVNSEAKTR